ncbi:MAG: hypothetical protein RSF90_05960, partial [Pygmaiobacter sp.]
DLEHFTARLARLASLERNPFARILPLPLKNIGMNIAYKLAERTTTASYSNVGTMELPARLMGYVETLEAFNSTGRMLLISSSFQNNMTLSFTSAFISTDVQRTFFKKLVAYDIPVTILSNETGEEAS